MTHLLHKHATKKQLNEMLEAFDTYIKLAVDVRRGILAGSGEFHADCEAVLIENGSRQDDVWGADWVPSTQEIRYEALMNIRPRQDNPSMNILNPLVKERVSRIVKTLLKERK